MIYYRDIQFNEISTIKDLWEKNRKYHEDISTNFGKLYSDIRFEERMEGFSTYDAEHIKITIAEDDSNGKILGYLISTIDGVHGEPQTLHVLEDARKSGIGKSLMEKHLVWLKDNKCEEITITVSHENTNTIEFYEKLGFKPHTLEMRMK